MPAGILRRYFYPRSPCGERRGIIWRNFVGRRFLSTLSLRRATCMRRCTVAGSCHFYPRSPCGERLHSAGPWQAGYTISIHALLAESDTGAKIHDPGKILFLSTLSLRRATLVGNEIAFEVRHFYPRSPCGERPSGKCAVSSAMSFLSTLSLRRATA